MTFSIWHIAKQTKVAAPVVQEGEKQVIFDSLELAQDFIELLPPYNISGVLVIVNDFNEQIVYAEDWQLLAQITGYLPVKPEEINIAYQYDFVNLETEDIYEVECIWSSDAEAIMQAEKVCPRGYWVKKIINLDDNKVIWRYAIGQSEF